MYHNSIIKLTSLSSLLVALALCAQGNAAEEMNIPPRQVRDEQLARLIFCGFALNYGMEAESISKLTVQSLPRRDGAGIDTTIKSPGLMMAYDNGTGMPRSFLCVNSNAGIDMSLRPRDREKFYPSALQAKAYLKKTKILQRIGFVEASGFELQDTDSLRKYTDGFFQLSRISQGYNFDDELVVMQMVNFNNAITIGTFSSSINYAMKAPQIVKANIIGKEQTVETLLESVANLTWLQTALIKEGIGNAGKDFKEEVGRRDLVFCHENNFFNSTEDKDIEYYRARPIALCRRYEINSKGSFNDIKLVLYIDACSGAKHAGFYVVVQSDFDSEKRKKIKSATEPNNK